MQHLQRLGLGYNADVVFKREYFLDTDAVDCLGVGKDDADELRTARLLCGAVDVFLGFGMLGHGQAFREYSSITAAAIGPNSDRWCRTTRPVQWMATSLVQPMTSDGIFIVNSILLPTSGSVAASNRIPVEEISWVVASMTPSSDFS